MKEERTPIPTDVSDAEGSWAPGGDTGEGPDFRHYIDTVIEGRWILVSCLGLALLLGAFQLKRATPIYTAEATLKYEPSGKKVVNFLDLEERSGQLDEIKTQIEVIRSAQVTTRVLDALGGWKKADGADPKASPLSVFGEAMKTFKNQVSLLLVSYQPTQLDDEVAGRQRMLDAMHDTLHVRQVEATRLIIVSFEDRNPRRAALIADEYCTQYINLLREEKTADYRYARKWLSEQIELVRGQLDGAEESLSAYRPKVGIQALEQSYEIALETMRNLTREIETSRNEIATLTAEKEAGQSPSLRTVLLAEDARYNQLTTRLRELELQRLSLIAQNTANHPDVKRLSAEIDVLNEQIASGVTLLLGEVSARRELASIRLDSLQQRLAEQAVLLNDLQEQKQRYESAEREVAAIREVYQSLLDRSKELDVTSEFESTNVTVLSKASVPEYPSSPKIMRTMAIFSTVGLGFGVGLVFLLSAMDRSVKDPRKVESQLGMPTLGFIPFLKASSSLFGRKRPDRERLIPHSDASSPEAEAFRVLRTALQYSSAGQPPKVIVITSCLPKEGKSTVAANLAASYALRGDRVLLIDADLKAPVIHKTFEKSREPGLSDILTGQKLPEAAIMPSGVENLDLLTAGPATPSPADLLESKSMHDLLARLRGEYSLIVVDSAPIFGMADTLVLSRATDGICLLVNRGETPNDVLQKVARQLFQLESRILGVIYNDRMRRTKLYGGYGYGYGYGADEERRESYSA